MWPLKSTIVRSIIQGQWSAVAVLSRLDPGLAGRMAVELALRTRRSSRPAPIGFCERPHYTQSIQVQGHKVAVYRWLGRGPRVLVCHGWNSAALRMMPLIEALRAAGFEVVAFDHIGHGQSSGRSASLARFARVTQAVQQQYGPFLAGVGHSMGAAGLALARSQSGLALPLVLLAPPADVRRWFAQIARQMGFSESSYARMERFLERREQMDLDRTPPEVTMGVEDPPSLLLIGQKDREVSPEESRRYERGPVRRLEFAGLDHKTLCTDAEALDRVVEFLGRLTA
ncbi:alpha/beta fold hydrolase [bacterium]|nr:alpha/beta fold hydrolase [bacterium]